MDPTRAPREAHPLFTSPGEADRPAPPLQAEADDDAPVMTTPTGAEPPPPVITGKDRSMHPHVHALPSPPHPPDRWGVQRGCKLNLKHASSD